MLMERLRARPSDCADSYAILTHSQVCLQRIGRDVPAETLILPATADYVVVRLSLPKWAASSEKLIDRSGAAAFPRLQNCTECDICKRRDKRMKVVGHDDPLRQCAAGLMSASEGLLQQQANLS